MTRTPSPRAALVGAVTLLATFLRLHGAPLHFDAPRPYLLGHVSEPIAIGDLNGDTRPDVVIANTGADGGPGGDSVSVLLGSEAGDLVRGGDYPAGDRPEWITLADMNSDKKLDVIAANYAGSTVAVLLGDGTGGFADPLFTSVAGAPRSLLVLDVNGDKVLDVITSNYDGNTVTVLWGGGNGTFLAIQTTPTGSGPEVIARGNFNGDAFVDLVTADALGNTVTPLLNDGSGRFTAGPSVTVDERPRFVLATDLDADGLDDLVVANTGANTLSFLRAANGTFSLVSSAPVELIGESLVDPVFLAHEDVTGDGLKDLLVTWAKSDTLSLHPGTASAFAFGAPYFYSTGSTPVGIAAADLDADGATDLVVSNALEDNCWVFRTGSADLGVTLDDGSLGTQQTGPWVPSEAPFPYGTGSLFSKDGTRYQWSTALPEPGLYEALLWWTVTTSRSESVPVEVVHKNGRTSHTFDQTRGAGIWHSLGIFEFTDRGTVTLTSPSGEASASADAVRFRPRKDLTAVPRRTQVIVGPGSRPEDITLGSSTRFLALELLLSAEVGAEVVRWTGAVLSPVGEGEEAAEIQAINVHVDSNGDGKYNSSDRKLAGPLKFPSDVRSLTLPGLTETISETPLRVFVVCETIRRPAGRLRLELSTLTFDDSLRPVAIDVAGPALRGWYFPEEPPALQLPGDANQDGNLNIADAAYLLSYLFQGTVRQLPCGNGNVEDGSNVKLLDGNGDRKVDLSDAVRALNYLFSGGPPHVLGTECTEIPGCPDLSGRCSR